MISVDTETTGLWFKHGCQAFALGVYNGSEHTYYNKNRTVFGNYIINTEINPETRYRKTELTKDQKDCFLSDWYKEKNICMHNAKFDVKALVNFGIFDEREPYEEKFWNNIIDTRIVSHIFNNTDERGLKALSKKYLNTEYESESTLDDVVSRCRTFVRSRAPHWIIAEEDSHFSIKPATGKWVKMDMWLPREVVNEFNEYEINSYFGKYYEDPLTLLYSVLDIYLYEDCKNTHNLASAMINECCDLYGDKFHHLYSMNSQLLHVTYKMENEGITLHSKELNGAIFACEQWIKTTENKMKEISGLDKFTPDSLRELLYERWQLPYSKVTKKSEKPSTDITAIEDLKTYADQNNITQPSVFLGNYIVYKKYLKKLEYLKSYERASINGKVYPSINLTGTKTTRVSSSDPNEQNISKVINPYEDKDFEDVSSMLEKSPHLRSVFGPQPNYWWLSNDYNQLQLRIFAVASNEEEMISNLNKGYDAHDITARRIYGISDKDKPTKFQRRVAKNVNFGFIFGASPRKIETTAGIDGLWDTVCEMFPNAHAFIENTKIKLKTEGIVHTLGGYPLDVPSRLNQWKGEFEKAAHAAVCYIIQGTEGEIVKKAMYECDLYLTEHYPYGRLAMQVHDELNFEMKENFPKKHAYKIKEIMESSALFYKVNAPVNCEIIKHSWNKGIEIKL